MDNEYYLIDLPQLLLIKDQIHAAELLEQIDVSSFPHIAEKKAREEILKRLTRNLPKLPKSPPKSAEEQYLAQLARMRGGR
ncbi:putative Fe-S cluster-containing radical SAM superfamily protein [Paenibacillus forsythiae]|uniref:Fe-S cluster-containing radical SAM superfamily protein n=1 Tax=Paenibacillus forsythiae TaxID=365616 RepID=A0ABU3H5R1_9BACL|nr:hypothetical protein [Paenibacillus forsythiae]MDT3426065.1 putative Fe-S cluster-containing radical SAM superfamily protein [Paenibacillus forsythiae]